jgi:ATP-dependent DNA ligase
LAICAATSNLPPVAPLPGFVAPMQAMLVDAIRPGDWIYEIKFDAEYKGL